MKTTQSPIFLIAIAAAVIYGALTITDNINERLSGLHILPADPNPNALGAGQISPNLQKLYPLVADTRTPETRSQDEGIDLDSAFRPPPPKIEKPPAPVAPDYFKALQDNQLIKLSAISDNGAIIDGVFMPYGATIDKYAYPSKKGTTAPRLQRGTTPKTITIQETPGRRSYLITL